MSGTKSESSPPEVERTQSTIRLPLLGAASALQFLVFLGILIAGTGWWPDAGDGYVVALLVSMVGFGVMLALAFRPRLSPAMFLVPVITVFTSVSLYGLDTANAGCSEAELAAVESIAPPSSARPEFRMEPANGCIARFPTEQAPVDVVSHYRSQFDAGGWALVAAQTSGGVAAVKDGFVVDVTVHDGSVIVNVYEPRQTPEQRSDAPGGQGKVSSTTVAGLGRHPWSAPNLPRSAKTDELLRQPLPRRLDFRTITKADLDTIALERHSPAATDR